jgi:hypothetical protein
MLLLYAERILEHCIENGRHIVRVESLLMAKVNQVTQQLLFTSFMAQRNSLFLLSPGYFTADGSALCEKGE